MHAQSMRGLILLCLWVCRYLVKNSYESTFFYYIKSLKLGA